MDLLTITAIDGKSSDTMSRTFFTKDVEKFRESVREWETEIPYRRYELTITGFVDDCSDEIIEALDDLEITY